MKPESFEDFARRLAPGGAFRPMAHYDPDGDCIEVFFSNEDFVGERLDRWVTIFRGRGTREIVGSLIKDVAKLMEKYPGLDIDVYDGRVRVSHMLRAPAWSEGDRVKLQEYKTLIDKAEESDVTAELCSAGADGSR